MTWLQAKEYFDHLLLLNMRKVAYGSIAEVYKPELLQKTYGGRLTILSDMATKSAGVRAIEKEAYAAEK
jgi:manganese/zinc/iron transport system ATP- binding protein